MLHNNCQRTIGSQRRTTPSYLAYCIGSNDIQPPVIRASFIQLLAFGQSILFPAAPTPHGCPTVGTHMYASFTGVGSVTLQIPNKGSYSWKESAMPVSQCFNFGMCINRRSLMVKVVRAKTVSSNHGAIPLCDFCLVSQSGAGLAATERHPSIKWISLHSKQSWVDMNGVMKTFCTAA